MEQTAERITYFVDVVVPLPLPEYYTYRVPFEYNEYISPGQRVVVQFGQKKLYSALVRRVHQNVPSYKTKYILSILDPHPIVSEKHFKFWEWMAAYYMCSVGDIMAVALPSAFRLASESTIAIHQDFSGEYDNLSEDEIKILEVLSSKNSLPISEVSNITGYQKIFPLIKTMIEKKIIVMEEEIKQRYVPKKETYLSLNPIYRDSEDKTKELFDNLEKKKTTQKQLTVLLAFFQLTQFGKETLPKKVLTERKDLSPSSLKSLIESEVLLEEVRTVSRLLDPEAVEHPPQIELSEQQQSAINSICDPNSKNVVLLHGVTSSGKTEVYIKLIETVIQEGKQVLYLLPEIALTAQIINRLRKFFGGKVGVYHSKFSTNERAEVWTKTIQGKDGGYQILLGARSAVFLPFDNLGLVIVDEEHDNSYKQAEPAPRYNGRDSAIYLAHIFGAKTVLGSATPAIESYYNAQTEKYSLAVMDKRFGGLLMPEILCVDMKDAHKKKEVQLHYSKFLMNYIQEALDNKEQVILFQNRRGFSLRLECDSCHWIPECKHCDVSLVYHKQTNSLRCHYCGYSIPIPTECPACHSSNVKMKGFGTEKIEEDLEILFPDARIARMDLDSTSQKKKYVEILEDFEDRKIDILVGTQMITKGLDFDNASVVGILSADNMISFPDFRAFERSFQQMTQVSGRAGRHGKRGKVIIQTFNPYHQVIRDVIDNNYLSMYQSQINERRVFKYPPFYKLIRITVKHKESVVVDKASSILATNLRSVFGNRVLGPEYPSVSRIRNQYLKNIQIRFQKDEQISLAKKQINTIIDSLKNEKEFSQVRFIADVDPQ
jgi:primosomal protein N' (replication factor Y)